MPAQTPPPAPRTATTRTAASRSARSSIASSPSIMGVSIAFFLSGRLSVAVRIPASTVTSTRSVIAAPRPRGAAARSKHLALGVGLERGGAAAVQRAVQQEIQRVQIRQLEPLDRARDHALEVAGDARRGHVLHED